MKGKKMGQKNYEQIKQLVYALKPFTGNSMSAVEYYTDDSFMYVVFSYKTPIALYFGNDVEFMGLNHSAFVTTTKYGVTSSKQTNIVKNNWPTYADMDESELRAAMNKWTSHQSDYRRKMG
jgi:hypothetical protein